MTTKNKYIAEVSVTNYKGIESVEHYMGPELFELKKKCESIVGMTAYTINHKETGWVVAKYKSYIPETKKISIAN